MFIEYVSYIVYHRKYLKRQILRNVLASNAWDTPAVVLFVYITFTELALSVDLLYWSVGQFVIWLPSFNVDDYKEIDTDKTTNVYTTLFT